MLIVSFRSRTFAQRRASVYWNRINRLEKRNIWKWNFDHWEIDGHHSVQLNGFITRSRWHLLIWVFGLPVKVVESTVRGAGLIPGCSQLRQKVPSINHLLLKNCSFSTRSLFSFFECLTWISIEIENVLREYASTPIYLKAIICANQSHVTRLLCSRVWVYIVCLQ